MAQRTTPPRLAALTLAVCALEVRPGERRVRIFPAGQFDAPRGSLAGKGPWLMTEAIASEIAARNASRSTDIPVDYEHQILLSAENGKEAPAAGWIDPRSLVWMADGDKPGLYGDVQWTPRAAKLIEGDEYRYLSPVFPYDPETGEVLDVLHVALTNTPGIDEPILAALSARAYPTHHQEPSPVNELLKKLLAALGLPEATAEADALAGVAALKARADDAQTQIAALKSAAPTAPDPTKYVPIATFEAERTERVRLAALTAQNEVGGLIEQAVKDGRLLPAQREHAEALGKADVAALRAFLGSAPKIAALSGMQSDGKSMGGGHAAPSDEALAVCKVLGLTAEEFAKAKIGG